MNAAMPAGQETDANSNTHTSLHNDSSSSHLYFDQAQQEMNSRSRDGLSLVLVNLSRPVLTHSTGIYWGCLHGGPCCASTAASPLLAHGDYLAMANPSQCQRPAWWKPGMVLNSANDASLLATMYLRGTRMSTRAVEGGTHGSLFHACMHGQFASVSLRNMDVPAERAQPAPGLQSKHGSGALSVPKTAAWQATPVAVDGAGRAGQGGSGTLRE